MAIWQILRLSAIFYGAPVKGFVPHIKSLCFAAIARALPSANQKLHLRVWA